MCVLHLDRFDVASSHGPSCRACIPCQGYFWWCWRHLVTYIPPLGSAANPIDRHLLCLPEARSGTHSSMDAIWFSSWVSSPSTRVWFTTTASPSLSTSLALLGVSGPCSETARGSKFIDWHGSGGPQWQQRTPFYLLSERPQTHPQ